MPRSVTLVLLDADGVLLGALPPFDVERPWWPEVAPIQVAVRERYDLELRVLRLLTTAGPPPGGDVSYLAQTVDRGAHVRRILPAGVLTPVEVDLADDPRRAPYARPGGPTATMEWGATATTRLGLGPVVGAQQQRTWNLSTIWRLDTPDSPLWIKEVPHFFAHEPAVLGWLGSTPCAASFPRLLATEGGRMLLADIAGDDLFHAPVEVRAAIASDLHRVQLLAADRSTMDNLVAAGVPDRRTPAFLPFVAEVAEGARTRDARLDRLVADLPERLAAIDACGLPDTLCHGDLHPGNARGVPGGPTVIMDWGDAFIGNPGFDILRLTEDTSPDDGADLIAAWAARWRSERPGCDPERAVRLLRPVAALRNAAVYADFLRHIEPSEYPYHADDPPVWLAKAAEGADGG